MEQKTSFPVLGEGYYKELEQQKNELNKQAQMLLAEEEAKGKQQMIDQAIEETKTDSPVEETSTPKKKTKQEYIEDAKKKGKQVYRWIKLHENHFTSLKMRKLRKLEHGETKLVIYLKIVLHSLKWNGFVFYEKVGDTLIEEIADAIGEDVDLVNETMLFMVDHELATFDDVSEVVFLNDYVYITGSDTNGERQRVSRAKQFNEKLGLMI